MSLKCKEERGFSLVEVLAAIVILSIFTLVLTSYFTNALSSTKHNQSKTVMIHLARNTLFYFEKQEFAKMEQYFREDAKGTISSEECIRDPESQAADCSSYSDLVYDPDVLNSVLNPVINGITYSITIAFQPELDGKLEADTRPYLVPVSVTVRGPGDSGGRNQTVLEGYITDEKIR